MRKLRDDLYGIRGWVGSVHLLVEESGLTLIDAGFVGDFRRIRRAIQVPGFEPADLKAILITHGHLDHVYNAAALKEWSGARIYAPKLDKLHVAGRFPYRGLARVCGALEACGRGLFSYRTPAIDHWYEPGESFPYWGGLEAVSLPGHTAGHCGFYSKSKRVLFAGDLFAIWLRPSRPPAIFNADKNQIADSMQRAAKLEMDWIVPNHYWGLNREDVARFRRLAARLNEVNR